MENREAIEWLKGCVVAYEVDNKGKPNGNVTCELTQEVIDMAISALEKQEADRWIPFKCREATDDDCTSFDYIMEGNLPEDGQTILITVKPDGHEPVQVDTYYDGGGEGCYLDSGYSLCDEAIAWMPLPEPYTEEES